MSISLPSAWRRWIHLLMPGSKLSTRIWLGAVMVYSKKMKQVDCQALLQTFEAFDMSRGLTDGLSRHLAFFLKIFKHVTLYRASHA
jgi:hypothetical protein